VEKHRMPQWLLAARCEVVASNLRKIEKGVTQPGVMLAVRIIAALETNVGDVFRELAMKVGYISPEEQSISRNDEAQIRINQEIIKTNFCGEDDSCVFGPFLKSVRVKFNVSQQAIARFAKYHIRNILEVESGRREPGAMTALALVCATGCDVAWFFNQLAKLAYTNGYIKNFKR
jgi:DNA-binding XRE family transcriptional regulator